MKTQFLKKLIKFIINFQPIEDDNVKDVEENIVKTIEDLDIEVSYSEKELNNIPDTGAFIVVSNHPFGGIDGFILLSVLLLDDNSFKIRMS